MIYRMFRNLGLSLWLLLMVTAVQGKATTVTLAELVKESPLIVYGHVVPSSVPLKFSVTKALRGGALLHDELVPLCNQRSNSEWPDLAKLKVSAVLFLVPSGDCFSLSHNYRSVAKVANSAVTTEEIRGQPDSQPLDQFLDSIRSLASQD